MRRSSRSTSPSRRRSTSPYRTTAASSSRRISPTRSSIQSRLGLASSDIGRRALSYVPTWNEAQEILLRIFNGNDDNLLTLLDLNKNDRVYQSEKQKLQNIFNQIGNGPFYLDPIIVSNIKNSLFNLDDLQGIDYGRIKGTAFPDLLEFLKTNNVDLSQIINDTDIRRYLRQLMIHPLLGGYPIDLVDQWIRILAN